MKVILEIVSISIAFAFELLGRIFHSIGSVCMGAAIMILQALSPKKDE